MQTKFSIIIPIYNCEQYLKECIDSIINQKYKEFELILVNDGSTDGSGKICDAYTKTNDNIKYIDKKNGGVSSARNAGLKAAKNEYIIFVDSDDILEKNALKNMSNVIEKCNDFDLIQFSNIEFYTEIQTSLKNTNHKRKLTIDENNKALVTLIRGISRKDNLILPSPWCKVYRKKIIDKYNLKFNEDFTIYEDGIFNIEYLLKCKNLYISNDVTYFYRKSNLNSATRKYNNKYLNQRVLMIDYLENVINKNKVEYVYYQTFVINSLIYIVGECLCNSKNCTRYNEKKKIFLEIKKDSRVKAALKNKKAKEPLGIKKKMVTALLNTNSFFLNYVFFSIYNRLS